MNSEKVFFIGTTLKFIKPSKNNSPPLTLSPLPKAWFVIKDHIFITLLLMSFF